MRKIALLVAAFGLLLAVAGPAGADHSWGNYHWSRSSNPFTVTYEDNTTWDAELDAALADWSQSSVLDTVKGNCGKSRCVNVHNGSFPESQFAGVAWVYREVGDTSGHIIAASVRLNDYVIAQREAEGYENYAQYIMCQEIGHTLGLDHAGTGCMGTRGALHPDAHDYEQLETIYAHTDSGGKGKKNRVLTVHRVR
jgi:hypothetical protein